MINKFAVAWLKFLGQNGPAWEGAVNRVSAVLVVLCAASLAVAHGRQGAPPPAPKPLVPAAASSIAASPEAFYGQIVSVTASVDQVLSPTSFTVDQDPKRPGAAGIVVLADVLNEPLTVNAYVTVIGEVVRHQGRPAIRAASVITSAMIDIAKRPPPPMTADEERFDALMKRIGPAFTAVRQSVTAASGGTAAGDAAALSAAFREVETFWQGRDSEDARRWAAEARAQAASLEQAVATGRWDDATAAAGALQQACSACHRAYRQRLDDGSYRIRMGN
jgi:cytochrome c556